MWGEALPLDRDGESGRERRPWGGERREIEGALQGDAQLGAGNDGRGGKNKQGGVGLLEGALQPIPRGGGNAAEIARGGVAEIEEDELQVGVAGEEIGERQGVLHSAAAQPDEAAQIVGGPRAGVEIVGAVDEGRPAPIGANPVQNLTEEELGAATGRGADELGHRVTRQAAGEAVESINPDRAGRFRSAVSLREALAQELAKRSKTGGGRGHAFSYVRRRNGG